MMNGLLIIRHLIFILIRCAKKYNEAEKMSPLLQSPVSSNGNNSLALNMVDVVESMIDADSDSEEHLTPKKETKKSGTFFQFSSK